MTRPNTEDLRKAVEPVRTSLLAAVGAGDLVAKAVLEAVNKARDTAAESAEAVQKTAQKTAQSLPSDVSTLREKLDPAELRKAVDEYTDAAVKLYRKLADQGEVALDKFRAQPQVKKVVDQLEEAIEAAQTRAGGAVTDARDLAEDVLARVTRKTRSVGEKTARATEKFAGDTAEAVTDLGEDVAHEVRSTSRKVANRTAPARKPATGTPAKATAPKTTAAKTTKSTTQK